MSSPEVEEWNIVYTVSELERYVANAFTIVSEMASFLTFFEKDDTEGLDEALNKAKSPEDTYILFLNLCLVYNKKNIFEHLMTTKTFLDHISVTSDFFKMGINYAVAYNYEKIALTMIRSNRFRVNLSYDAKMYESIKKMRSSAKTIYDILKKYMKDGSSFKKEFIRINGTKS